MAKNFDIPSLSSKVDPEVRRAFNAIKSKVESLGEVISDEELTGTRAFMRKSTGELVATNIQTLNMTVPPPIVGLTATPALNSVLLQWTPPDFLTLARVEVWRSLTDDIHTAGMVGTTGSTGFLDTPVGATVNTVYYYWVRIVSAAAVVGPFNKTEGTAGSISDSATYILDILADQIGEPELTPALNDRIDIIDAPVTGLVSRMDAAEDHAADTDNPHVTTLEQATAAGANSPILFSCNSKVAFTPEGGLAVRLINKTGSASVKGMVVTTGSAVDNSYEMETAEYEAAGIVYESGVADGGECWVVTSGMAEVLIKDGTAATRGNWTRCADTDGRAEVTAAPSGIGALAVSEHFKEIGHCLESKTAGTNVLAKVLLHFN